MNKEIVMGFSNGISMPIAEERKRFMSSEEERDFYRDIRLAVESMMETITEKELSYFLSETDCTHDRKLALLLRLKDDLALGQYFRAIIQDEAEAYAERRMAEGKRLDEVWESM